VLAVASLGAALAVAGWCVVQATRADALAETDPEAALRLDPEHPRALLGHARRQLAAGDDVGATASGRRLLKLAPGQGDAFAMIALAATRSHAPNAERLLEIAAQRAPRIPQVRAQLATMRLREGDLPGAMTQLDALLRFEPEQGEQFFPALVAQSVDPRFADVMAATLARYPRWRRSFIAELNARGQPAAKDNIYSRLLAADDLSAEETRRWLDDLMAQGRWGDAFSNWFSTLRPRPKRLPSVRNGGFEEAIDGAGFGWRNTGAPGAITDIEEGAGSDGGRAAHTQFIGIPSSRGNLRQALLLVPGRYRLSLQARAEALRSDQGLIWMVRCARGPVIGASGPLEGSFDWRAVTADFEVPARRCEGQWLELRNPAVPGMAQQVQGDLWTDDVAITPLRGQ
jgi:hypothetical protein